MRYHFVYVLLFLLLTGMNAVAAPNAPKVIPYAEPKICDPLESFNRIMYRFNTAVDTVLLRPVATAYTKVVPRWGRARVGNVLHNLGEPITALNSLMQGDPRHSIHTFWRFAINSTFGILGMFDVAKYGGLIRREEDFGQTLGRHKIGNGPYLMLPFIGPSTFRDTVGSVIDALTNPFNYIFTKEATIVKNAVYGVHRRSRLLDSVDAIVDESFDPYATIRSLYLQKRQNDVNNGQSVIRRPRLTQ